VYKDRNEREFDTIDSIILEIKKTLTNYFSQFKYQIRFIVLSSHSSTKYSYHIILRLKSGDDTAIYFENVSILKSIVPKLFPELTEKKIIDTSVYREGLFRTMYSTKTGEIRPLVKDILSDPFQPLETFVCYNDPSVEFELFDHLESHTSESKGATPTESPEQTDSLIQPTQMELRDTDKVIISNFVRRSYKYKLEDIREILLDREANCIIVALHDTYCYNVEREHRSNHQYIAIDTFSSKQKCHDPDCTNHKFNELKINQFPPELNEIILKCLKVNKREQELIERAIQDCKDYISNNFDDQIEEIQFDRNQMIFTGNVSGNSLIKINGKCPNCKLQHYITNTGYCLKCTECGSIYPKSQLIPVDDRYKNLNNFWINWNQLVNNGTVNIINNFYNNSSEEEFSCDVQLDASVIPTSFGPGPARKKLLKVVNECLDGHKITKLAELMHNLYKDYVFTGNEWYFFSNSKWKMDNKSLNYKRNILELCHLFNKIKQHYIAKSSSESTTNLIKNIKSLVTKLNKPQLKDDILKESQLFYVDTEFYLKLNSKKHLVPFENGVYDLLSNNFRKTKKEDWINYTVRFDYDPKVRNSEVYQFIESILPNRGVRDYVLKKMSECLNGDIPNTNFLMFIGDGANGKSQLLNLMKAALGEFGEKVEVTLLTRKRNNANEANTEKIKLMNKRFAFLSEPEDGEKINIGLLKELTGSEEIVARGLYQDSISFVMEAKLFLACNELPEIKGEDTALWRRIRVIDFPSRFVDDPKEPGEYKIDRTLPSRMREDISWRQTFINILLEYYYLDVPEPEEVKVKTNEYRQENNDFYNWLEENIVYKEDSVLNLKDICKSYYNKDVSKREKTKCRKELEKWISKKFVQLDFQCKESRFNGIKYNGWKGITFKNEYD
jgi:P4 family phage/plasmid primase-like protien